MSDATDVSADVPPRPQESTSEVSAESIVEALFFSTDQPLTTRKIAQILGVGDAGDVKRHIDTLNERDEHWGASFRIEPIAKGFQMLTRPLYNPWLSKLHKVRAESRLSTAASRRWLS